MTLFNVHHKRGGLRGGQIRNLDRVCVEDRADALGAATGESFGKKGGRSMRNSQRIGGSVLVVLGFLAQTTFAQQPAPHLDVNDVSILWPVPQTADQVEALIAVDETGADGNAFWPEGAFQRVLEIALSDGKVTTSTGMSANIDLDPSFVQKHQWKVVGIRFDPSAPGAKAGLGSLPQIRLVVQPVTVSGSNVTVHDVTAHLVFNFGSLSATPTGVPFVPDRVAFQQIVDDLVALKTRVEEAGIQTNGPLGLHPGFVTNGFASDVRALLKKHLRSERLQTIAFMGIEGGAEPWIFFAMRRVEGQFQLVSPSGVQMLTFRGAPRGKVVPEQHNRNLAGDLGVSTAALFGFGAEDRLDAPALGDEVLRSGAPLAEFQALRNRDIPDIIANPDRSNVFNTDCVSCHTESGRRSALGIQVGANAFKLPAGISGVDPKMLPNLDGRFPNWNVRNFGWFPPFGAPVGQVKPTVTQRAANEAAESADIINREYLGGDTMEPSAQIQSPTAIARPLTLVMTIKSEQDRVELETLLRRIQSLPPEQNPIAVALQKLGTVHFARFVFLDRDKLAVITTYDGDFEAYVGSFVNEIGDVFDQLLEHMKDAPRLPVSEHRQEFLEYVKRNDVEPVGTLYSAYSELGVQDILDLAAKQ